MSQLDAILSGGQIRSVETPQLGKVEYQPNSVSNLQRIIYGLQLQCLEYQGADTSSMRRKPISMVAEP